MDRAESTEIFEEQPTPPSDAVSIARWRWMVTAIITLTAVLFFVRLGVRALWSSEFRWAEIAREMLVTHNYFWPTINGIVYYDKPLGTYWLVVGAARLTGAMNEAAARIPSAIAGLLAVFLLIAIGRRFYDKRTGATAGLILATSFSFVFFSRLACADVETIAGELAAIALFMRHEDDTHHPWVVGLWLIMAITSLTKGLLGFVLPIMVIGTYACFADGWNELTAYLLHGSTARRIRWLAERNHWFFNPWTVVALALAGVIYYAPFAVSHAQTGSGRGLYMVYRENVERFFKPFDHRGPIYLYTYVIFVLMAPWSAFLPAALVQMHSHKDGDYARSDRFALVFFWSTFIFFTLSGSRRSYYLLPILPAAAIIVSRVFTEPYEMLSDWARRLLLIGYFVIAATAVISGLAFLPPHSFLPSPWDQLPDAPAQAMLAIYWVSSLVAIGWALRRLTSPRILLSSGIIAYLFMIYFFVFAMPAGDAWRGEKAFALQVRQIIGSQPSQLAFFTNQGPSFYLALPRPVPEYGRSTDIAAAVAEGKVRWIVVRRRDLARLKLPMVIDASEAVYPWDPQEHRLNTMLLVEMRQNPQGAPVQRRMGMTTY
jgi:4-amino-4-deoxy-L-arabinose transferase-like glycosyltransferase